MLHQWYYGLYHKCQPAYLGYGSRQWNYISEIVRELPGLCPTYSSTSDNTDVVDSFGHLSPSLSVPVRTLGLCFVFNACFGLLYLGPSVAFSAYVASCTIFLNVSYAIPVIVLLIRGRSALTRHQVGRKLYSLGRWGLILNWVSAGFVVITSIVSALWLFSFGSVKADLWSKFFCFPVSLPVDGNSMNYVCVVIGIFVLLCIIYWMSYGHRFEGPVSCLRCRLQTRAYLTRNSTQLWGLNLE